MIESIQKVIKVGSSAAVTIPAKLLKAEGIKVGDKVRITITPVKQPNLNDADQEVIDTARQFIKKYNQALKNLAER